MHILNLAFSYPIKSSLDCKTESCVLLLQKDKIKWNKINKAPHLEVNSNIWSLKALEVQRHISVLGYAEEVVYGRNEKTK